MIRQILNVRDPILRRKSKPVGKIDKKVKALIQDLKDTLNAQKDPEGVGLAAPQIGKNVQVFAMKPDKQIKIFINPKVIWIKNIPPKKSAKGRSSSGRKRDEGVMEGCLSLPHYFSPIKKPNRIKIKFTNEKGVELEQIFKDFEAQVIQHEIDHLDGKLFIDRILEQKKPLYKVKNDEWEEVELF